VRPHTPCDVWAGRVKNYQAAAARSLTLEGREPSPWSWITTTCGGELCIEPDHLVAHAPRTLAYPRGLCIYCGRTGGSRDHLLPRNWSGETKRHFVVTVPACGTCNSVLSDTLTWSITERRTLCHQRLHRKYAKVLKTMGHTPAMLDEYGPTLRAYVMDELAKKRAVLQMLAWPVDPTYDARALELSGIEDPYVLGLILAEDAGAA
jgi:5-methylcytosine-specific restriction endonuclease McrA